MLNRRLYTRNTLARLLLLLLLLGEPDCREECDRALRGAAFCNGERERGSKIPWVNFHFERGANERVADISCRDLTETESGHIKRAYSSYVPPSSIRST